MWCDFTSAVETRKISEVDFAVKGFGSPAPRLRASIEIAQVGIDTQQADEVQVKLASEIMTLPCDQRYDTDDMALMADRLVQAIR